MIAQALLTSDSSKLSFHTHASCLMVVRWLLYFQFCMHIPNMMRKKRTGYERDMYQLSLLSVIKEFSWKPYPVSSTYMSFVTDVSYGIS